jgi:hypothetical protein
MPGDLSCGEGKQMRTASALLVGAVIGIVVVAASLALVRIPAKNPPSALDCDDDTKPDLCMVKVDVVWCGVSDPLRYCVSVLNDPVVIHNKNDNSRKKIDVYWTLVNTKYKFASNGIVIANGDDELAGCKSKDDGVTFFCKNNHTKFGAYKYSINVTGANPLDPWVIND